MRAIDPPPFDDPVEAYLDECDIPKDCFQANNSAHAEVNPEDIGLNPVGIQATVSPQGHEQKQSNKESDQEKTKNQLQNAKESTQQAIVIDNKIMFSAEKILIHRKRNGKVEYLVKWLNYRKSQTTWEPEDNISDKHLIDSYLLSQNSVSLDCFSLPCCLTCVLCFHLYFFSLFTSHNTFFSLFYFY